MAAVTAEISRYRKVPGGLDNAVEQADARGLRDMFIVDIDCHIYEPFSSFQKYLPEKWRAEYNDAKILDETERYEKEYKLFSGETDASVDPVKLKLLKLFFETKEYAPTRYYDFTLGGKIRRPEVRLNHITGMTQSEIVDTFINRMADIGIKKSILFPNILLSVGNHPDHDYEVAVSNAYTDYMLDQFLDKYPELHSCILLPANSPDKAAELIDRVGSEKGIIGGMVTAHRATLAGEDSWLPIYQAARRKGLPICFHASESNLPPFDKFHNIFPFHALAFPLNLIIQMTSLVSSGIPERFPDLKFVLIEGGVTWVPWMMHRLDTVFMMMRSEAPALKKLPSEYIKQFYFSSQPLERPQKRSALQYAFDSFNAETQLMYASDYPHHDFDLPSVIYDLPFLSPTAKKNILGENARRVFRLKN